MSVMLNYILFFHVVDPSPGHRVTMASLTVDTCQQRVSELKDSYHPFHAFSFHNLDESIRLLGHPPCRAVALFCQPDSSRKHLTVLLRKPGRSRK